MPFCLWNLSSPTVQNLFLNTIQKFKIIKQWWTKKENIFILSSIWSFLVRLLLKECQHRLLHLRFGYGFNFFSSWSKSLSFYSSNRLLPFFTSSSQNRYRFICSNTSSRYHQNNSKSIRCFWYIRCYCSKKAHVRFIELMFDLKPSQSFAL